MSWLTQFWGWLNTPAVSRQDRPDGKLNAPEKDGLSQAKAVLAAEQMQLADELERLFQAYDEKVQNLALRVRQLPAGAAEAEIRRLRAIQHELQSAVRRLEASSKTSQELEKELAYWQKRLDGRPRDRDAVRRQTEVLRSELAIRTPEEDAHWSRPQTAAEPFEVRKPIVFAVEDVRQEQRRRPNLEHPELDAEIPDYSHWPSADNLVLAIREATREAERWHAIPVECHDEEALIQIRHVKELNAWLKRVDRRDGTVRDRLELAISPRELKY